MFTWIEMNKYISKKVLIIVNIVLFLLEVFLIYLMIKSIFTKDLISPSKISLYEYLKVKLSHII